MADPSRMAGWEVKNRVFPPLGRAVASHGEGFGPGQRPSPKPILQLYSTADGMEDTRERVVHGGTLLKVATWPYKCTPLPTGMHHMRGFPDPCHHCEARPNHSQDTAKPQPDTAYKARPARPPMFGASQTPS